MCELFKKHPYIAAEVAKKNGLTPIIITATVRQPTAVDIVRFSLKTGKHCGGEPNVHITADTIGYTKPGLKRPIVYFPG